MAVCGRALALSKAYLQAIISLVPNSICHPFDDVGVFDCFKASVFGFLLPTGDIYIARLNARAPPSRS